MPTFSIVKVFTMRSVILSNRTWGSTTTSVFRPFTSKYRTSPSLEWMNDSAWFNSLRSDIPHSRAMLKHLSKVKTRSALCFALRTRLNISHDEGHSIVNSSFSTVICTADRIFWNSLSSSERLLTANINCLGCSVKWIASCSKRDVCLTQLWSSSSFLGWSLLHYLLVGNLCVYQ